MALRGTVVRGNNGSHPYIARYADGTFAGNHKSVADAEKTIEASANKILVWTLEARPDAVEAYRGDDPA